MTAGQLRHEVVLLLLSEAHLDADSSVEANLGVVPFGTALLRLLALLLLRLLFLAAGFLFIVSGVAVIII